MISQKLWLIGMFRGDRQVLEKTLYPVICDFDGLICVVDSRAKQEDIAWLNSIKMDGEIIVKKWVNDHAHTMNETLFTDKMKFGDYCIVIDETDLLTSSFTKHLKENIKDFHEKDIGAFWIDHPLIIRYHAGVRVVGSPHWTVTNILGRQVDLKQLHEYKKELYVTNTRDTLKSGFLSPIKYTFVYPPFSNHFQLLYGQFSQEIWAKHENMRINFQLSCQEELGLELTVDSLKNYMINNVGKYPDWFEDYIEIEVNIKDAFRLFVLKQDWIELHNNRFNFSYFTWKKTGEIIQPKTGEYEGLFNKYKMQKGESPE